MFGESAEGSDPERTIARIWRVTLDHLAGLPFTADLLRILAWYAPDTIPRSLLTPLAEPIQLQRAIRQLAAYSMITADATAIGVHRLVQAVARTPDPVDPHRGLHLIDAARGQAADLLRSALPAGEPSSSRASWPQWSQVLPHIESLAANSARAADTEQVGYLLNQAGAFLDSQGVTARAISHFDRACVVNQRALGASHPFTLACRNNLALAYEATGDLPASISLFEQAVADADRELGAAHPDTLTSRNNLAGAYQRAGDLRQAMPLYRQVLRRENKRSARNMLTHWLPGTTLQTPAWKPGTLGRRYS